MSRNKTRKTKNNGTKILVILVILALVILAVILGSKFLNKESGNAEQANGEILQIEEKDKPKIKIVDEDSKTRPFAVMINNNHAAWPQCGLDDAYLVYEIIAEGGITRMMALFKDKETAKVGSVRSARHYFIDYVQENDAIFIHWGGSPQAYSRISSSAIDAMDGIALEGSVFFRDRSLKRDYEHTGFVDLKKAKDYAEGKGYNTNTTKDLLLNYSVEPVDMSTIENVSTANNVTIRYSDYHTTSYAYDAENKVYNRSMSNKANVDLETGKQYTAKNIIIYKVSNYTLSDGENKGRQELENVGSGEGYFVTEGSVIPITWSKSSHSSQTIYKYQNGEELVVNDGNTFIQICPINGTITIE